MIEPTIDLPLSVRSHPRCLGHQPGLGHPETPERVQVVLDALSARAEGRWVVDRESPLPPDEDTIGTLAWIHDPTYIERVREASAAGSGWLDSHDCGVSSGTFDAAVAAAGLALQAALDVVNRRLQRAFVVARPPAHHAGSWNRPVVIADFGALHGDGTQQHFFSSGEVGFVSIHRYPAFPGGGGGDEVGEGEGLGTTRNVPLAGGAEDDVFCAAFSGALGEICGRMQPAAILLSAGFDAHREDPVGGMKMTEAGFGRLTSTAVEAANRWSEGRVLSFLEGGFELEALAKSARIHVEELAKTSND
jgi:acetoin utilization deacetylase AcuC-like enzyme